MVETGLDVVYKPARWSKFVLEKLPVTKLVKMFLWNRRFPTEFAIVFIVSQMNPVYIITTKGEERGGGCEWRGRPRHHSPTGGKIDGKIKSLNKKKICY